MILLFFDEEIKEIEEKLNKIFEKNKKAILLKYSDYNIFLNKFLKIKEKEKVKNNSLAFKFLIEEVLKDET
ncbi:MAG: hypothetical protein GYA14_13875 [Ignavibacteria bacterium]|nr:hypothetical protein [Ignavibacteria bacterium]